MPINAATLKRFADQRASGLSIPDIMRADERNRGNSIFMPGLVPWLKADDWEEAVISRMGKTRIVRILLIHARREGQGAFKGLVEGIVRADLCPVVIAPLLKMTNILRHWGWRERIVQFPNGDHEEWWLMPKFSDPQDWD